VPSDVFQLHGSRSKCGTACRKGLRSVVLESSPTLRTSGLAFITWTNAFRALDALGVGDKMRSQHQQIQRYVTDSEAVGDSESLRS
jgi:2-polyprenyl-6-methoxyphenol hydroxylase-like FAD-dependent oxidoreductase